MQRLTGSRACQTTEAHMAKKKAAQKNSNAGKKIALVILSALLLALIAVVILIGVKSEGFKNWDFIPGNNTPGGEEEKPFALIYDDRVVDEVNMVGRPVVRIYVQNGGKYSVKVQPKASVFFDFRLDGMLHGFTSESGDYNKAFNLDMYDDYFEISSYAESITDVLNLAYLGHVVSDVDETANLYKSYFEIIVTSQDGQKKTADIIGIGNILTIKLNPDKVVF